MDTPKKNQGFLKNLFKVFTRKNKKKTLPSAVAETPKSASATYEPATASTNVLSVIPEADSPKTKTVRTLANKWLTTTRKYNTQKSKKYQSICPDSGVCIALGIFADEIKIFFNGFTSFDYVDDAYVIENGKNSFITEIKYVKYGYKAYAVLKSTFETDNFGRRIMPDNLLYEYLVGEFINKQNKIFPCFLETYGLFKRDDRKQNLKLLEKVQKYDFKTACESYHNLSLLIQHLNNVETLDHKMMNDTTFIETELLYILFQIYIPLDKMKENFTHYDLHPSNVLVYEPKKGKYIEYVYYFENNVTVRFKSRFIAKIIDYGRCFFKDTFYSSNAIRIKVNQICGKIYGYDRGFSFFYMPENKEDADAYLLKYSWLTPQKKNISHDLMLLNHIIKNKKIIHPLFLPDESDLIYTQYMGTPENRSEFTKNNKINNVTDAANHFIHEVQKPEAKEKNDKFFADKTMLGELHIFMDKPMKYIPAQESEA